MTGKFSKISPQTVSFVASSASDDAQMPDLNTLSRSHTAEAYGAKHRKRTLRKRIITAVLIVLAAAVLALVVGLCVLLVTSDGGIKSLIGSTSSTPDSSQSADSAADEGAAAQTSPDADNAAADSIPLGPDTPPTDFNPKDYKIDVRNGCGTKGIAIAVSDKLNLSDYQQGDTGNAVSYVYSETLVLYNKESQKKVAEDIIKRLGCGRAIHNSGYYQFKNDLLVIVGADFKV